MKTAPAETTFAAAFGRALIRKDNFRIVGAPRGRARLLGLIQQAFARPIRVNDIDARNRSLARKRDLRAGMIPHGVHSEGDALQIRSIAVDSVNVSARCVHENDFAIDALAQRRWCNQWVGTTRRRWWRRSGCDRIALNQHAH